MEFLGGLARTFHSAWSRRNVFHCESWPGLLSSHPGHACLVFSQKRKEISAPPSLVLDGSSCLVFCPQIPLGSVCPDFDFCLSNSAGVLCPNWVTVSRDVIVGSVCLHAFSRGWQSCPADCPMSENCCCTYFPPFSSCLRPETSVALSPPSWLAELH